MGEQPLLGLKLLLGVFDKTKWTTGALIQVQYAHRRVFSSIVQPVRSIQTC